MKKTAIACRKINHHCFSLDSQTDFHRNKCKFVNRNGIQYDLALNLWFWSLRLWIYKHNQKIVSSIPNHIIQNQQQLKRKGTTEGEFHRTPNTHGNEHEKRNDGEYNTWMEVKMQGCDERVAQIRELLRQESTLSPLSLFLLRLLLNRVGVFVKRTTFGSAAWLV